jgi:hypothetical protein
MGSMGPTFGSFAKEDDSKQFANTNGGKVYRFGEITPDWRRSMAGSCTISTCSGCIQEECAGSDSKRRLFGIYAAFFPDKGMSAGIRPLTHAS